MDSDLEARILDGDPDAYVVYGDLLQSRGDPRGELVIVQTRLAASPGDPELRAREAQLLKKHGPEWLGVLAHMGSNDFGATWRGGFLHAVRIGPPPAAHVASEIDVPYVLSELARIPGTTFVRELVIGAIERNGYPTSWSHAVAAIAAHGVPPNLDHLSIVRGGFHGLADTTLGDLSAAYPRLHRLRELTLELGALELGMIELPALRALTIRTCGLTKANIESLRRAHWPALERLTLWLGETGGRGGCDLELADLRPVLAAENLGSIRHLALANSSITDGIVAALAGSKVLRQLATLDLSGGTLSDDGARVLLEHRSAFSHLYELDLSHAYVSESLCAELATVCPRVVLDDPQSPDDDYRIVAIAD